LVLVVVVILVLIVYIKVVVVKKFVVECLISVYFGFCRVHVGHPHMNPVRHSFV